MVRKISTREHFAGVHGLIALAALQTYPDLYLLSQDTLMPVLVRISLLIYL